jgi:hypothetical protein
MRIFSGVLIKRDLGRRIFKTAALKEAVCLSSLRVNLLSEKGKSNIRNQLAYQIYPDHILDKCS